LDGLDPSIFFNGWIESNQLKINCLMDGSDGFYSRWTRWIWIWWIQLPPLVWIIMDMSEVFWVQNKHYIISVSMWCGDFWLHNPVHLLSTQCFRHLFIFLQCFASLVILNFKLELSLRIWRGKMQYFFLEVFLCLNWRQIGRFNKWPSDCQI